MKDFPNELIEDKERNYSIWRTTRRALLLRILNEKVNIFANHFPTILELFIISYYEMVPII